MTDEPSGLDAVEAGPRASDAVETPEAPAAVDVSGHASVSALKEEFGDAMLRHAVHAGDQWVVWIGPERAYDILRWLKESDDHYYDMLSDVTGVDYGGGRPMEVVWQLFSTRHGRELRLRCPLPEEALEVASVYSLWKAADWLEREVFDLFGVVFTGHPDLRRILMPDDYAEGHPLRKDFPLRGRFSREEQTRRALAQDVERFYLDTDMQVGGDPQEVGTSTGEEA